MCGRGLSSGKNAFEYQRTGSSIMHGLEGDRDHGHVEMGLQQAIWPGSLVGLGIRQILSGNMACFFADKSSPSKSSPS